MSELEVIVKVSVSVVCACYRGVVTHAHPLCMLQVNSSLKVLELRYNSDIDATAGQLLADAIMVRNA